MKLSIERLLIMFLVFLVFTTSFPINSTFSSDAYLDLDVDSNISETTVTVRHQDEFGNDLIFPYVASINQPGELYIVTNGSEQLPEYDWISTIGNTVGFHEEHNIEVIFIYRRRPLITITPDKLVAQPGDIVTYTIAVTNNAAGIIADRYTVRVQFDQVASSMDQLEFVLDYLAIGATAISFSTMVDQNVLVGNKSVQAVLIHPSSFNIADTQTTTQIEIVNPVVPPIPQLPENEEPPPMEPPVTPQPIEPSIPYPPINPSPIETNPRPIEPPIFTPDRNNESDNLSDNEYEVEIEVADEGNLPLEDESDNYSDEHIQKQYEPTTHDNIEKSDDLPEEDGGSEIKEIVEEVETENTITMVGTSVYDTSILGAIGEVLSKKGLLLKK